MLGFALAGLVACGSGQQAIQDSGAGNGGGALTAEPCNLDGTWALKFMVPVKWPASLAILGGAGDVVQWARVRTTAEGNTLHATLSLCGSRIPANDSQPIFGHEIYDIQVPDAIFDAGTIPPVKFDAQVSGFTPGSTFNTGRVAVLLGMTMENAATAPWPLKAADITSVDDDQDGKPGVTVVAMGGTGHAAPPVNMFHSKRADKFYTAIRNVAQLSATVQSCDKIAGPLFIPIIGDKPAINSRVLGCHLTSGHECGVSEYELIDKVQSGFLLNGDATVIMRRVDDDVTCSAIRAMEG